MFDLMQYALIFYDFQLILARMLPMGPLPGVGRIAGGFSVSLEKSSKALDDFSFSPGKRWCLSHMVLAGGVTSDCLS
jgi:hypothetical protein